MRTKGRIIILLITTVFVYTFFITQALSQENVLRYALKVSDIAAMDAHYAVTTADLLVSDLMFNSLCRFPPGTITFDMKKVEGELAERWESSEDGLVWTFHLRKGVKFHHGYGELTAEDVKFSFERAKDPKYSAYATQYQLIEKAEALSSM